MINDERAQTLLPGKAASPVRLLSLWVDKVGNPAVRNAVFLCGLFLICGASVFIGTPWFYRYTHDVFVFLDGGWRILHTQRPHVDFFSGVGPVTYRV
jgi:hypothetical protein